VAGAIALFVSLSSISTSYKKQLDQSIACSNIDIIVRQKGASTPLTSRIEMTQLETIRRLELVQSAIGLNVGSIKGRGLSYLFVFGISSATPALAFSRWLGAGIIAGRTLVPGRHEVLLGRLAARRMKKKVGEWVVLGTEPYHVERIYWLGKNILDGGVFVDLASSQKLLSHAGSVNLILVTSRRKRDNARLLRQLNQVCPTLSAIPARSLKNQIRAISMIDNFITAVSVTALLLSGVLIMNTLLMAITERTREIGILMAIGWPRRMIVLLLVCEGVMLGLLGGVAGYMLAFPALALLGMLPAMGPGWLPPVPDPTLLLPAIVLAGGIALLSSLYPAFHITRLLPAEALRYE
jgi:putative ABC transport system permease protein